MIELNVSQHSPPTVLDVIAAFPAGDGPVPESLIELVLRYGGAQALDYEVRLPDGSMTAQFDFLGVNAAGRDIRRVRTSMRHRLRGELIPFARDGVGNLFAVWAPPGPEEGSVWYWDHDTEDAVRGWDSIDQFLEALQPVEASPVSDLEARVKDGPTKGVVARLAASELPEAAMLALELGRDDTLAAIVAAHPDLGAPVALRAAEMARVEVVRSLLKQGLSPATADKDGTTLLMKAALSGNDQLVDLLLAGGADPRAKNSIGQDAERMARMSMRNKPLVEKLAALKKTSG